ncbi:calcium-binding protein [Persicobacter psychrovividus]|uniref:Uncharacterized protein n=1 Tax=Persicobacter psychrovividus TaxID=387638 RepID=A0ABM7VF77_9BACT|nr:hypothetical protein PEPS_18630 [Persicobacter psychrovividus]
MEEEEIRISEIIQDSSLVVSTGTLIKYLEYIKKNVKLPLKVTGVAWDFLYSDYGADTPNGRQVFELIGFDNNVEQCSNLFAEVRSVASGKVFSLQLFEFQALDQASKEGQILADYSYWIENYI